MAVSKKRKVIKKNKTIEFGGYHNGVLYPSRFKMLSDLEDGMVSMGDYRNSWRLLYKRMKPERLRASWKQMKDDITKMDWAKIPETTIGIDK